jgi:hypothetical protein
MSIAPDDPTAPLDLARFGGDARALGFADFCTRHGSAFLLHQGALDPERKAIRPQQTMVMRRSDAPPPGAPGAAGVAGVPGSRPPASDAAKSMSGLLVYPIRNTGRSPFPRIVTVGRTKNNDVVLADISISKFHAFFKEEGGQLYLADGESRNGTFVDGQRALTTKQGKATLLKGGCHVKFGALEFRFIDAKELVALVRQFA